MIKRILTLCAFTAPFFSVAAASASELGLSSSQSYSYRTGTGSSVVYFQTTTQLGEINYFGAIKNSVSDTNETGVSQSSGTRNITESTLTTGSLKEDFNFGNTSRNSFVGVFSR